MINNWHSLQSEKPINEGYYLVNLRIENAIDYAVEAHFDVSNTGGCFTIMDCFSKTIVGFYKEHNFKRDDIRMKITHWTDLKYPQEGK